MSSITSTSTFRNRCRNSAMAPVRTWSTKLLMNVSHEMYWIVADGVARRICRQIACSRCVLPSPTFPWMNSGLYDRPGPEATASPAACAIRLLGPTTKCSKS